MIGVFLLVLAATVPADLSAVGVVVAGSPDRSVAILHSEGRTRVVRVGENVFGGRLLAVSSESVSLLFDGERIDIRVTPGGGPREAAAQATPSAPPPRSESEPEAPPHRVMKRDAVHKRLGLEMNRIMSETAIRPVTDDGRVVGMRLTRVAQDSLLTEAGLHSGDVLTTINGTEIDGMATLISLWPRLQGASELQAQGLRDGRPFSISLSLE